MEILSYLFAALPFAIAFLVALALCTLAVLFMNSAMLAMGVVAAIYLLEASSMAPFAINLGIWVYLPDLFVALLSPAFFYRLVLLKKFDAIPRAWWVLGAVWLGLFVWGVVWHGTGAGVDFRPFFYLWLGAAYLATFDYSEDFARRCMKFLVVMGAGICAIAYYRWTMGALDYEYHRELERLDTTGVALPRVMTAGHALILACALIVVASQAVIGRAKPMTWLLAGLFGITVVALQHRSVWVAAGAGFIALALMLRHLRSGAGSRILSLVLMGAVLLLVIAASGRFQGAVDSVQDQAVRATSTTGGTFVGRVMGWKGLLNQWAGSGSPVTYLVGKPFGSGYERYASDIGSQKVGYMPHNFYVQLLYRGGLVGLAAFLWAAVQCLKVLRDRLRDRKDAAAPLLFAMLVAQLVYYVPYGIDYGQMILFGLLLGMVAGARTQTKPASRKTFAGNELCKAG